MMIPPSENGVLTKKKKELIITDAVNKDKQKINN